MVLSGVRIKNFRSFDSNGIIIERLGKVNLLIGKNNSGKSNVLKFISKLPDFFKDYNIDVHDVHQLNPNEAPKFSLLFDQKTFSEFIIESEILTFFRKDDVIIVDFELARANKKYEPDQLSNHWLKQSFPDNKKFRDYMSRVYSIVETYEANFTKVLRDFKFPDFRATCLIGNFRKIEKNSNQIDKNTLTYQKGIYNGFDLLDRLDSLKNPTAIKKQEKLKYKSIINFLRDLLNEPTLELNISHDAGYGKELSLEISGNPMPLENLGTGIHQLIIMALTITILENYIICIEEPEIFIHTEIQRKFINYLKNTNNQYFISTHSNAFLNMEGVEVYHITHDGVKSTATKVLSSNDKNIILDDLGFQASDILQCNYLIWVEGPSDRIYLNHWIKQKDDSLIEGIHYAIMFCGGRLLSHLQINEKSISDFIALNKLNRNTSILIDSDKKNETDKINETKQRIINEFRNNQLFVWVTEGKEIENYIPEENIKAGIQKLLKTGAFQFDYGKFLALTTVKKEKKEIQIDKIKLAKIIIESPPDWGFLDLEKQVKTLIEHIRKASHLK